MSEPLDPELSRALQEPARLVRADPSLLEAVREGGAPAQQQLLTQSEQASSPEDRYASAAMLAALFHDRGPLEQVARGYGATPPPELLALVDVVPLRPALRQSLSSPVRIGLLEWATHPDPHNPPLELAMAARDLEVEDVAVLRLVASRAEQVAQQDASEQQSGPLLRVAEVLRAAADAGGSPAQDVADSRPSPQEPAPSATESGLSSLGPAIGTDSSGPRVTTHGIPESEMLREDELNQPDPFATDSRGTDPRGTDYPGTGVPVRDSLNGPRGADPLDHGPDAVGARPVPPQPLPPRQPSTNELYYGVGSDRHAQRDPNSPETREDDKHIMRNWGIVFLVIIVIFCLLVLLF